MAAAGRRPKPNRDTVTTIAEDGSRNFLRPSDVRGRFTVLRRISAAVLITVYVLLPWIPVNGHPAMFLDVIHRKFHLLGITFTPQDTWLFFFLITGWGFSIFFVTSMLGRLWCGWICPQTVFLEHVYRRIERLLEGPSNKQRELDAQAWNFEKIARRGTKHILFILVSSLVAHVFLSYFISIPMLYDWMLGNPADHWGVFLFMVTATALLYFNFSWFREQLCLAVCPYGRLQSAMIDENTFTVGYDSNRGEPRGKATVEGVGDCINCHRCVQVCPTGIDIRQGMQMDCVGCFNCIDACDEVMEKIGRKTGLVRYDSMNGLTGNKRKILRPRVVLYGFLFVLGFSVMIFSATRYSGGSMTVSRMVGEPFFIRDEGIRNQYQVRLVNKRNDPVVYTISVDIGGRAAKFNGITEPVTVLTTEDFVRPLVVTIPKNEFTGPFPVIINAESEDGKMRLSKEVVFLGPDPDLIK